MTDRILLITPPDDTLLHGLRILHIELTEDQNSIVSEALFKSDLPHCIINYVWKMGNPITWLLDKIPKSDIVIFNADNAANGAIELLIGWTAAQPNSYYFGKLKDLHVANDRAIYTSDDLLKLMEKKSKRYD